MKNTLKLGTVLTLLVATLAGCPQPIQPAPYNVGEYKKMGRAERVKYHDDMIVSYNLTRVFNDELSEADRINSLELVSHIGVEDPAQREDLATLLRDSATPTKLRREVLRYLLKVKYRDLAAYVLPLLNNLGDEDPALRKLVLDYLATHPSSEMLAGIVRAWSTEPTNKSDEDYKAAIEKISGKNWSRALLDEINTPSFAAKYDSWTILCRQLGTASIKQELIKTAAVSEEFYSAREMVRQFGYLPNGGEELKTATILYRLRKDMMSDAASMARDWGKNDGYRFNLRDFHLVGRLRRDPLRNNLKRTKLEWSILKALRPRGHVAAVSGVDDKFINQTEKLSLADLWNIYLLNEMFDRPIVQASLKLLADADQADTRSGWGGLVFYLNGQAEIFQYKSDPNAQPNDLIYNTTRRLESDSRDSMCRFICHFNAVDNAHRAGPTKEELADAKTKNYYGVIFTRISENKVCAHYFNPAGQVVSLGKIKLREATKFRSE